jgi:hypothetical protein
LYKRVAVDGLRDITANKLSTIIDRTQGKDFVDLFFLLRRPDVELDRGIADCHQKFGWPSLRYALQERLLACERIQTFPETDPSISAEELRAFFRKTARSLIKVEDD